MSVSTIDADPNVELCGFKSCDNEYIQRIAYMQCSNCNMNVCIWCSRQGFQCMKCNRYCCKKCESKIDWLNCKECLK